MIRSLRLKLVLAFLLVSLTGAALASFLARQTTMSEFDRFLLEQAQANFVAVVKDYYQTTGSWNGAYQSLQQQGLIDRAGPPAPGGANRPPPLPPDGRRDRPPGPNPPRSPPPPFMLISQAGQVIIPIRPYKAGDTISAAELAQGIPLEIDGRQVGTVLSTAQSQQRNPLEIEYLNRINRALLFAALGATAVALIIGVLLARTLTRPLRELTTATQAVAKGDLGQKVPVRSRDELGELAVSFNQMSTDLARANQLREQMTADIAHDLRTPLAVLSGYIEALRDGILEPSPAMFEVMYDEAQHLRRLIEDLRTLSLADAGNLSLKPQPVSPRELLERITAAFGHQARQRQISLEVNVAPELPTLTVDRERMNQVIANLVSNAMRYTPADGRIMLWARPDANQVMLGVQDNGSGIAATELPRIFDRFYRVDQSRYENEGESGLGLAIARAIVEAHGGSITAESELGQGTTMLISLPAGSDSSPSF